MTDFALDDDMNIEVIIRFIEKGTDEPLTGDMYTVRLFDKDLFDSEFLGESGLDANGYSKISFNHSAFANFASLEAFPDIYFTLYKDGIVLYKSKVIEDIDLSVLEEYKKGEGEVIDLGTFLISAD
ncbi:hypothetical protein BH11BAC3_BH11BAC3_31530 [soil metagenome]